ncbi:putative Transmembrane protein, partial [Quillaja saponaria]
NNHGENGQETNLFLTVFWHTHFVLCCCSSCSIFDFHFHFFSSSGSSQFLVAVPILLLSTMFLMRFTKKKEIFNKNPVQDKVLKEELEPTQQNVAQNEATQQSELAKKHQHPTELPPDFPFPPDGESSRDSNIGENYELSLVDSMNEDQRIEISDDSASESDDEDSLIEISLPRSKICDLTEEPKQKLQTNLPDFLPESIFRQQGLMELLAEISEMNEEENLIEIDISM